VVFGISGTGTLKLGVKDDSDIADHYDNTLNAPVADDTTIDVLSGSNPSGGDRFWDGNITSGVTDGVSQGGNGTWDTTTTNWDPGFGFANPNAWNNANNDTAILGGANGVATLAEPITVGGIRIDNRNIDISGSTLTFGVAGEINSTDVGNQNDPPTISSKISGAAITKTGAGYIQLTNNANDFAAFTLSAGTLGQLPGGTYTGIGTGLFTINGGGFFVTNNDETIIDNDTVWNGNWFTQNVSNAAKTTTWNGNVTLGGSVQVASKHRQVFNGDIDETGGARKLTFTNSGGASWIALNGDNSFTGGVQVNQGTLNINSPTAIGTGLLTLNAPNVVLDNTSGSAITLSTNNTQAWNQNFAFTGTNDLNLGTGAANINNNRTVTITAGTLTVGGGITQSGGTRTLAKAGNGTLVLGGANSYAGNTTVSAGTLALVGGSQNSAITVNSGAALGFALGSPTTSSKAVTLSTGHAIAITGTVNNSSDYLLMSATSFTGTPTLSAAITDYELELREGDTELWLAYTGISGPTPPELLTIANDVDNGPVLVNTPVTYTLTFSKDMDATTIDAGDFSNAGTSNISIGSIDEVSPTVFTVVVTPTSEGILQLQINQDAVIEDVDELALDTTSAIIDAIEITVEDPPAPSSPFDDWATGGELFNDDASGDGIANGLAFLLGADGPGDNALDLLPTSTEDGGALVLTFSMRNADERGDATLSVEYGNDLAGWTTVLIPDVAGETVVGDVTFNITLGDPLNSVTASIASGAANAGKLFARLSGDDGVAD
jgi:autotransporter-associated beta strand protein